MYILKFFHFKTPFITTSNIIQNKISKLHMIFALVSYILIFSIGFVKTFPTNSPNQRRNLAFFDAMYNSSLEFQVTLNNLVFQSNPAMGILPNGFFMVAWIKPPAPSQDLHYQLFFPNGTIWGLEQVILNTLQWDSPIIIPLANGNYSLIYYGDVNSIYKIYGFVISASGNKLGVKFQLEFLYQMVDI